MKKIITLLLILAVPVALSAQAVAEGAGMGATAGAALGSFIPGLGNIAGAFIGGLFGLIGGAFAQGSKESAEEAQKKKENEELYNQALNNYNALDKQSRENELLIKQTKSDISSFDEALGRWGGFYENEKAKLELDANNQYQAVLSNWQGSEIIAATRGQTGGSAALIASQEKQRVKELVGADMTLDMNGGLIGSSLRTFELDMVAQYKNLINDKNLAMDSLTEYQKNQLLYQDQISAAAQNLADAKRRKEGK